MTSLSSYISGRTPGGGGRGGNNSQQSQPSHDSRGGRGGGLMPNGRGSGPRGRGKRGCSLYISGIYRFCL